MKFLLEVNIPTEIGNKGVKDGTLIKQLNEYLSEVKPEAAYFTINKGRRTVFFILNIENAEKIPEIAEPFWLDWHADVNVMPVMNEKDFEKAGPSIQRIVDKRR